MPETAGVCYFNPWLGMARCLNTQILKDASNLIPLLAKEIDSLLDLVFALRPTQL